MADPKHIVIAVHGIRDFGQWQDRLENLLLDADKTIVSEPYRFGYFSVLAFLIPFARWLVVLRFRIRFAQLVRDNPDARFSFVAHSFGTHIVAHAIKGMKPRDLPQIDSIILAGSVLRSSFDWPGVIDRSGQAGKGIGQVINDCGWDDNVLILSQLCVLFTGMAGRVGFEGFVGRTVRNRFFPGGHGHYFQSAGEDPDAFMREFWVPVLATGTPPKDGLPFPRNSVPRGAFYSLLRLADPIKLVVYGLLFLLVWNVAYLEPRRTAADESYRRQHQQASAQLQTDQLLPDAFRNLIRLASSSSSAAGLDPQHVLARFAQQRLLPVEAALAAADPNAIYLWGGHSYLLHDTPIRLSFDRPVAIVHVEDYGAQIAVAEGRTIWLIDDKTGEVRWTTSIGDYGQDLTEVTFRRLKNSTKLIVDARISQPAEDEDAHAFAVIDLAAGTGTLDDGEAAATTNCDGVEPAMYRFADDDDTPEQEEAHRLALEAQEARTAECLLPVTASAPKPFRFPSVIGAGDSWTFSPAPPRPEDDYASDCIFGTLQFPHDRRTDIESLHFHGQGDDDAEFQVAQYFQDSDCFLTFDGPGTSKYLAVSSVTGSASLAWHICELKAGDDVGRCTDAYFYYLASGDLTRSPNRRYLVLSGDGSEFSSGDEEAGGSWSLFDLVTMRVIDPPSAAHARTSAAALTDSAITVAVPVLSPPGGVELWAYRYDCCGITLVARQIVPPPDGFALAPQSNPTSLPVSLVAHDGSFILTTISQQVASFAVTQPDLVPDWLANALPWLLPAPAEPLVTQWRTPPAGFAANLPVDVAYSADQAVLALSAGSRLRLVAIADGTFLTPLADVAALSQCTGSLSDIAVGDDYSLSARTDDCLVHRAAPPDALATTADKLASYLGSGTNLEPALPSESRIPPPPRPPQDPDQ